MSGLLLIDSIVQWLLMILGIGHFTAGSLLYVRHLTYFNLQCWVKWPSFFIYFQSEAR